MKLRDIKIFKRKNQDSVQKRSIKHSNLIEIFAGVLIIIFLNIIGNYVYTRFDLTSEKRYTLSNAPKRLLKNVDETVLERVYLEATHRHISISRCRVMRYHSSIFSSWSITSSILALG